MLKIKEKTLKARAAHGKMDLEKFRVIFRPDTKIGACIFTKIYKWIHSAYFYLKSMKERTKYGCIQYNRTKQREIYTLAKKCIYKKIRPTC